MSVGCPTAVSALPRMPLPHDLLWLDDLLDLLADEFLERRAAQEAKVHLSDQVAAPTEQAAT